MNLKSKNPITLAKWIWRKYLKTALIPVILIQVAIFAVFIGINTTMKNELSKFLDTNVNNQIIKQSTLESASIDYQLNSIKTTAELFAAQMTRALQVPVEANTADESRLQYSPDESYYTATDNGGAAVYYSGIVPVGETQREKVARVLTTQNLMKDIYQTSPLISSIYLNTYDSLNVIYPYIDVVKQYSPKIDIPSYNFYYEADAAHNPERMGRWTNVYLDPAGRGWMASSIAPVYNGDFLEGVVGIDVTVSTIVDQILKMDIPGDGYGILVGTDGTILALPDKGEADWGLTELTDAHYSDAIEQDTFKPDQFNLFRMENMHGFAEEFAEQPNGASTITLGNDKKIVSWETIHETGWKLLLIIPQKNIYVTIDQVGSKLAMIGLFTASGIIVFYIAFFRLIYIRSRKFAMTLSQPLIELDNIAHEIGSGNYYQETPKFGVKELQQTSSSIVNMGHRLGEITGSLIAAQIELRESEAYLQTIINSIDDAIIELDENGLIVNIFLNKTTYATPDMTPGLGSVDRIFPSDKALLIKTMIKEVIESGVQQSIETEVETQMGTRWTTARISMISREPARVVVTARDITERKEMEEAFKKARDDAEAANRAKSQFLSNMSHELRTPLNAVLGFAQVLEMDPTAPLNGMQAECVYEIMKAGNHLLDLINEVLDLARIEAGNTRLSIEPVDITTIMEETMTIVIPTADKYSINVASDSTFCSHKYVKADKVKLKQILINLLTNAIKYNKPNGKVDFYCEVSDDKVRFHIVDTGIGIPEKEMEAIFKPFYRLNDAKYVVEGTGVGLAVVKHLTDMMDGVIHIESSEGVGTHFSIELPVVAEMTLWSERSELKKIESWDLDCMINKKILYIEDNQANLRLVERVLERIPSVTFLSAQTAEQGIATAIQEKPDVILMDINLPGMDGYEAFEELQEYEETEKIPVIAVSSNAMEREIGCAIQMGFCDYITKPINAEVFLERIKRLFTTNEK